MIRFPLIPAILIFATVAPAQDIVKLKTGGAVEGLIVGESTLAITVQFPGGTVELKKSQIESITRSENPEARDLGQALLTLSRFEEGEVHHFVYRDGRRVGYRVLTLKKEVRAGIPGYAIHDRLVFAKDPRAGAELETQITEFSDAGVRPREFACQISSGLSSRSIDGYRTGEDLRITERGGGNTSERAALFREETEFPQTLLRRLATDRSADSSTKAWRIFSPRDQDLNAVQIDRSEQRIALRGKLRDLIVFRLRAQGRVVESWLDRSGNLVRQELGSPHLVSQIAAREDVLAFSNGEEVSEELDLELEFVSDETGLRLLRPDSSWEAAPGVAARHSLVSFLHPGWRATIDVLHIEDLGEGALDDGVALRLLARMQAGTREWKLEGPEPSEIGERRGLRFTATCRRHDVELKTLGGIVVDKKQAFVLLGAAPVASFDKALPGFREVFDSLRVLEPEGVPRLKDPFEKAAHQIGQ